MNLISTMIFSVCDHVFDKSSEGTFSLPLLPPSLPKSPTIEEAFNQSTNATFPSNIQVLEEKCLMDKIFHFFSKYFIKTKRIF